jgi:dimethylargininase
MKPLHDEPGAARGRAAVRWLALTREVSASLPRCELSHLAREPIDMERAREQHQGYRRALAEAGAEVIALPAEDRYPDAVFVEDGAVVTDEVAVITRPGAASRRGEVESLAWALADHRPLVRLEAPATLDGGDVLRLGRRVFVGRTPRTNAEGFAALRAALAPFGYELRSVEPSGCLHLKSAVAAVADDALLVNPRWVDPESFPGPEILLVPEEEPAAANLLRVGETLLVSDAYPRTLDLLARRGFNPRAVAVSEFHKAEGGLTCMSILFRGRG